MLLERGASHKVGTGVICSCGHEQEVNHLLIAATCGDAAMVHRLINDGAEINSYGMLQMPDYFSRDMIPFNDAPKDNYIPPATAGAIQVIILVSTLSTLDSKDICSSSVYT